MGTRPGVMVDALHLFYDRSRRPLEVIRGHGGGPTATQRRPKSPELDIDAGHRPGEYHEAEHGGRSGGEQCEMHTTKLPTASCACGDGGLPVEQVSQCLVPR